MAIRQYIGARYVPKFMGNYDNTQDYEALCVVDNGMGTSYITKQPTPAGTPLTDTVYWAVYGASSGAIINLQNAVDALNRRCSIYLHDVVSVDGSDVTSDIQTLFDDALENTTYILEAGEIIGISRPIFIRKPCNIIGDGSVIKVVDNSGFTDYVANSHGIQVIPAVLNILADNVKISGIHFNGNMFNNGLEYQGDTYYAYYTSLGSYHSFGYSAINNSGDNLFISNCEFEYFSWCGIENSIFDDEFHEVATKPYNDGIFVIGNNFSYCGRDAVSFSKCRNVIVSNNHFENNYWHDIHSYTNDRNVVISENDIVMSAYGADLWPSYNVSKTFCIGVDHNGYAASYTTQVKIDSNKIYVPSLSIPGINLTYGAEDITVENNIIDTTDYGIIDRGINYNCKISNNTIKNSATGGVHIYTDQDTIKNYITNGIKSDVNIINNLFDNCAKPIVFSLLDSDNLLYSRYKELNVIIENNNFSGDLNTGNCIRIDYLYPTFLALHLAYNKISGHSAIIGTGYGYTLDNPTVVMNLTNTVLRYDGSVVHGTINNYHGASAIDTIPDGYRPKRMTMAPCNVKYNGVVYPGHLRINTDGTIVLQYYVNNNLQGGDADELFASFSYVV